jgi:creatinine amidohydrolase/Fe(II)-dependent formamide hydrolase-like protein
MYETVSESLNEGNELAAYSWSGMKGISLHAPVIPIMSVYSDPAGYLDFVSGHRGFVLPPIPREALERKGLSRIKRQIDERDYSDVQSMDLDYAEVAPPPSGSIVVGSVDPFEEHAHHLSMDADNNRARGLVRLLAQHCDVGHIFPVPSISYAFTGPYERGFRGNIRIGYETEKSMIEKLYSTLIHDLRPDRVLIITSHAHPTHLQAMQDAVDTLRERFPRVRVAKEFDFNCLKSRRMKSGEVFEIRGHASRCETSAVWAYMNMFGREGLLDMDEVLDDDEANRVDRINHVGASPEDYDRTGKTGANGYGPNSPHLANLEEGREYVDVMFEQTKRFLETWDPSFIS